MAKHTQTIRRQFADKLFECVWPFYEIGAQRVNVFSDEISSQFRSRFLFHFDQNPIGKEYHVALE